MVKKQKAIVLIVEGDTEEYFYNHILDKLNLKKVNPDIEFKIMNVKGVGKFRDKSLRKYDNYLKKRNQDISTDVFLCYDHDVFKFQSKPPFKYGNLKNDYQKRNKTRVFKIEAVESI